MGGVKQVLVAERFVPTREKVIFLRSYTALAVTRSASSQSPF